MKNALNLDFSNKDSHVIVDADRGLVFKKWGVGHGWTEAEAKEVQAMHEAYVKSLIGAGFSVVASNDISIGRSLDENEYILNVVEPYKGQNILTALSQSPDAAMLTKDLVTYYDLICGYFVRIRPRSGEYYTPDNVKPFVLPDLIPQNFVAINDEDGKTDVLLVDTFRPRFWRSDGTLLPLPGRHEHKRELIDDVTKNGDARFIHGRLFGYFIAAATRWHVHAGIEDPAQLDAIRGEVGRKLLAVAHTHITSTDHYRPLAATLLADLGYAAAESITKGTYEGPRYVQELYERV